VITFTLEARPASDYNASDSYYFNQRIKSIDVKAGSNRLRYYGLTYTNSADTIPTISDIKEYDSTGVGTPFTTQLGYPVTATLYNTALENFSYSSFGSYEAIYLSGTTGNNLAAYTAASTPPNPRGGVF